MTNRYLPPGGAIPTRCCCEAGQYDEYGLPVRGSGVWTHPECPLHGGMGKDNTVTYSAKAEGAFDLAQRGYGD